MDDTTKAIGTVAAGAATGGVIAGLPGISIPCGVDKEGMPVGMQLIGNRFAEETLLNAAYTFEQKIKFREQYKPEFKK